MFGWLKRLYKRLDDWSIYRDFDCHIVDIKLQEYGLPTKDRSQKELLDEAGGVGASELLGIKHPISRNN